jgi:hypothetical protein
VFVVEEGAMVFCASDGVFDDHVWKDDELVTFFDMQLRELDGKASAGKASAIAAALYKENLDRSLAGGYVDDISLYCFVAGKPTAKPVASAAAAPLKADSPPLAPALDAASPGRLSVASKGSSHSAASGDSGGSPRSDASGSGTSSASAAAAAVGAPTARPVGASKSLPHSAAAASSGSAPRKSLLGGLWKGKPAGRATSKSLEIDEELLVAKPSIDKPSPEDRRHTIQRKEKASFTEVSNMLKDAMARQLTKQEQQPDSREMAEAILSRYASQHGVKQQEALETSQEMRKDAAKESLRQSKPRPSPKR